MKRLFSLMLVSAMVSYCGTAPIESEVKRDSRIPSDEEEDNSIIYIVGGSAIVLAGLGCAFIGGPKNGCRKFFTETVPGMFKQADEAVKEAKKRIEELKKSIGNFDGDDAVTSNANASLKKAEEALENLKKADPDSDEYQKALDELNESVAEGEKAIGTNQGDEVVQQGGKEGVEEAVNKANNDIEELRASIGSFDGDDAVTSNANASLKKAEEALEKLKKADPDSDEYQKALEELNESVAEGQKAIGTNQGDEVAQGGEVVEEADKVAKGGEGEEVVEETDKVAKGGEGEEVVEETDKVAKGGEGEEVVEEADKVAKGGEGKEVTEQTKGSDS